MDRLVRELVALRTRVDSALSTSYRPATVTEADPATGLVTVTVPGDGGDVTLVGVQTPATFTPTVGDTVVLALNGLAPIVLPKSIAPGKVTGTHLAPGSVDASKVVAGTLTYEQVAFRNDGNVVPDGSFENAAIRATRSYSGVSTGYFSDLSTSRMHGDWLWIFDQGPVGLTNLFLVSGVPVLGGQQYWGRVLLRKFNAEDPGATARLGARVTRQDGTYWYGKFVEQLGLTIAESPLLATGTITLPSDAVSMDVYIQVQDLTVREIGFDAVEVRPVIGTALISDLAADRITTGVLAAGVKIVAGSLTGARVEVSADGIRKYDAAGNLIVYLGAADTGSDFLSFGDGTGKTIANIDSTGRFSGQEVNVTKLMQAGVSLDDMFGQKPGGFVGWTWQFPVPDWTSTEIGVIELAFAAKANHMYRFQTTPIFAETNGVDGDGVTLRVRLTTDGSIPTVSSTSQAVDVKPVRIKTAPWEGHALMINGIHKASTDQTVRMLLTIAQTAGAVGPVRIWTGDSGYTRGFWVEDMGLTAAETGVPNTGGGGTTPPKYTRVDRWYATWSGTYNGSNQLLSGNDVRQGYYSATNGNQRGLIGFDDAAIRAALTGATINYCRVSMYATHWYYNSGGTGVVGTHGYSGRPSTWDDLQVAQDRIRVPNWPKPGWRTIDLGTGIGGEFQSGAARGIALGPGPTNDLLYYGSIAGFGAGDATPVIEIEYVK